MTGIKRNFAYNSALTLSNYVFPLIVFPYISRVLGVSNIGICNFVDSIVQWFILFSMMGITILGNREIAAAGQDRERRSKVFSELVVLNLSATLLAAVALIVSIYTVPGFAPYRQLLWVGVLKLFANFLCIEWYFKGTENFAYITSRTILVKIAYVVSVFLLVRKADDYPLYYLLTVLMLSINALINLFYARRSVSFTLRNIRISAFLKPFLTLGCYMLLTSLYVTFNVTYLGFAADTTQVGYYTTASKLYNIIISFFSAFTAVMLPRMSSLVSENRMDEFHGLSRKTIDVLLLFSLPLVFYASLCAPEIVRIFAGNGYEGAYLPARIMMPLILIVGLEQVYIIQILMPKRRDRTIFINSLAGAIVGVSLNLLLVRRLLAVGSSIAWLASELVVLVLAASWSHNREQILFPFRYLLQLLLAYIPLFVLALLVYFLIPQPMVRLVAVTLLTGIYTAVYVLFFRKDTVVLSLFRNRR